MNGTGLITADVVEEAAAAQSGERFLLTALFGLSPCVSHAPTAAVSIRERDVPMTITGNGGPAQTPAGAQAQPQLNVLGQYIKDFSFENPNAPRSLTPSQNQPAIQIQINVGVQQLAETDYEVSLKLDGKAETAGSVLFAFDLTFAGVFRIQNVPQGSMQPIIIIECPRLLFPFAREIVATSVRNGGFPPLLLDPVDFVSLYQQRMAQVQPGQSTTPAG